MYYFILFIIGVIVAAIAWSFRGYNEVIDVRGKSVFISGCEYVLLYLFLFLLSIGLALFFYGKIK
jgi:hypothetical protein